MVTLTSFFPATWILHLIRALVAFNVIHTMLEDKYNRAVTFFSTISILFLFSYVTITLDYFYKSNAIEYVIMIMYYVLQFAIVCVVSKGSLFSKLTTIIFSLLTTTLASSISLVFSMLSEAGDFAYSYELPMVVYLYYCLSLYALSYVGVFIIRIYKKRKSKEYDFKYAIFYLFPLTHYLNFLVIYYAEQFMRDLYSYSTYRLYSYVTLVVSFLTDFALLFIIEKIDENNARKKELEKQNTISEMNYQKLLSINTEKENFRKIKHDYSNLLSTAIGYIESGSYEKALDILQNTSENVYDATTSPICSNDVINTVYTIKHQEAKNGGVSIDMQVNEKCRIRIKDYDFSRILFNIIDNSINAATNSEDKKCSFTINVFDDSIDIYSNNANADSHNAKKRDGDHGYGLQIVKDILKIYDGSYSHEIKGDRYITKTSLKNKEI